MEEAAHRLPVAHGRAVPGSLLSHTPGMKSGQRGWNGQPAGRL